MLGKGTKAYGQIQGALLPLLRGRMIAVDPSVGSTSSQPGYAVYIQGELRNSGIISIDPSLPIWDRLHRLNYGVRKLYQEWDPDVLVYEDIPAQRHSTFNNKGNAEAHSSLLKAVGAILSVSGPDHYVGLHPSSWKAMVRPEYTKSDINDAIEMGWISIQEGMRIEEKDPPGKKYGKQKKTEGKERATRPGTSRSRADV